MITIGEVVSRFKNQLKSVKMDSFFTDRMAYSSIMKYGALLMRRQDNYNRIMKYNSIFKPLEFIELIDVDTVNLDCIGVLSGCKIKRTKDKLPRLMEGYWGPIIRTVASLDYSVEIKPTFPSVYQNISKQKSFKYNKTKYYWYMDGHLYFPNIPFDAVRADVVPNGSINCYNCDTVSACTFVQDNTIPLPEFLLAECEQMAIKDFGITLQIPPDINNDNINTTK